MTTRSQRPPRSRSSSDDNKVGYGRPPKAHQFKPGQSGNPKGRPKRLGMSDLARNAALAAFQEPISFALYGEQKTLAAYQVLYRRLVHEALAGKPAAMKQATQILAELKSSDPSRAISAIEVTFVHPHLFDPSMTEEKIEAFLDYLAQNVPEGEMQILRKHLLQLDHSDGDKRT